MPVCEQNSEQWLSRDRFRFRGALSVFVACIVLLSSAAQILVAEEPRVDEIYSRVHKWDFSGVNPHCISFDFDNGDFDIEGLSTKRLVAAYSAIADQTAKREGSHSARFSLRPGDRVSGGWRAELRDLNNAVPDSVVWYSISTMVPENFPNEPDNSFVLIQWHDQKVPWNNPKGHSPPLAARYREGRLDITLRHAFEGQKDGDNGRELILYSHEGLKQGEWHDFVYQIKWSASPDPASTGFVRVWMNGRQVVNYTGPVGYFDDLGPYVKFGVYARHDVRQEHIVYHDSYHRGARYEDVCIDCTTPFLVDE